MNADNYKISTLPYIENASNEIMEKYQIRAKYETEPPHGDAIYSISIKDKVLPFWIYGRDVTFIGNSMVMVESVRSFANNQIELTNQVVKKKKLMLNDFGDLEWISF